VTVPFQCHQVHRTRCLKFPRISSIYFHGTHLGWSHARRSLTGKCRPKLVNRRFSDKHFSEKLKLLRVKRLPSLAHDIAAIVDKTIMDSFNDGVQLPPSDRRMHAWQVIDSIVNNAGWAKTDESAVASFYDKTTALFCAPIASTLALRLSEWATVLMWTQSANVSGYAIADGFLHFAHPIDLANREALLKEVDEETFGLLQSLSTRYASLVTSEFKNMSTDGPEVMLAIPNLSDSPSFDWTSCNAPECALARNHETRRERKNVVGPDAKNTPWTFDSCSNSTMSLLNSETQPQPREIGCSSIQGSSEDVGTSKAVKRKRNNSSSDESRASSSLSILGMLLMMPQTNSPFAPGVRRSSRLAKNPLKVTQSTSLMVPPPPPPAETTFPRGEGKGKGKAVVKEDVPGGSDDDDEHDPSYIDDHELSAQFIVHQAS
jgi:hypothetical protein